MIVTEITVGNEIIKKQFLKLALELGLEVTPLELKLRTDDARKIGSGIYLIAYPKNPNGRHVPIAYADLSHQHPYISDMDNGYGRRPAEKERNLLDRISSELGFRRIRL